MIDSTLSNTAYLGLGSNLGNRAAAIAAAARTLARTPGITVVRCSSLYETQPVGVTDQPRFLNAALALQTSRSPQELLSLVLLLEQEQGRVRNFRWGPRVIDIDILLYGERQIDEPDLIIPHPRLAERAFALTPLAEIAPQARFPDGDTVQKKLQRLHKIGNNLDVILVTASGTWCDER